MDTPPVQRPFPFFDLPRELRDHIYSYLHHDHKDIEGPESYGDEPKLSLRCCPLASASLVCSQFAHECRDAKEKQTTMLLYDHMAFQPDAPEDLRRALREVRPLMQGAPQNVRFAEFHLTGSFYVPDWFLGKRQLHLLTFHSQQVWIAAVIQAFTSLESFQIRYSLTGWRTTKLLPRWSDKVRFMTTLKKITDLLAIPKLSKLELFAASGIPECSEFDVVDHELDEQSSIAIWTPDELWQCKGEESAFEVTSGSCGKCYCPVCA